jgi:hypothetical protein
VGDLQLRLSEGAARESLAVILGEYMTESPGPEILSSYQLGPMITIKATLADLKPIIGSEAKGAKRKKSR